MTLNTPIFFTVVIPVLNGEEFISRAIESIRSQSCESLQILVFDGGSTDQTLKILEGYPDLSVISGSDLGPHEVMNRGIEMAHGEVVAFLNCDDFFAEDIFREVREKFIQEPSTDIVGGGSAIVSETANHKLELLAERSHKIENGLAIEELTLGAPCFNTRFFRKSLFKKIGNFNLGYQYAADRDLLLRAATSGITSKTIDRLVYVFESHPNSRTIDQNLANRQSISEEHRRIAKDLIGRQNNHRHHVTLFRAWLGFEFLRQLIWNLRKRNWTESVKLLADAFRTDANWVVLGAYGLIIAKRLWLRDRSKEGYWTPPAA